MNQDDKNDLRSHRSEFLLKEYDAIRSEILARLAELWKLEKFAFGGAAAIAAWILLHGVPRVSNHPVSAAYWLPLALLLVCGARFGAGMYHLGSRAGQYIQKREREYLGQDGGWECWFATKPANETLAYALAWLIALALAIAFLAVKPELDKPPLKDAQSHVAPDIANAAAP